MKKLIIIICILYGLTAFAQKRTSVPQFPESFQLDKSLLPNFKLMVFDEIMKEEGFQKNPDVVTDKKLLQFILGRNISMEGIAALYYEIYQRQDRNYLDAGVQVVQFKDETYRQSYFDQLTQQPNYAVLFSGKDYLIEVWSDDGHNNYELLGQLIAYYQQVGAELQTLKEDDFDYETVVEEAYNATIEAAEDTADVVNMSDASEGNHLPSREAFGDTEKEWETDSIGISIYDVTNVDKEMWSAKGLTIIEEYQPEADYQLYRTESTTDYTLWCIKKDTPDEWVHWGILFDKQDKLLGYKVFAYDNSEGFLSVYTKIKDDEIRIYTENIYETEAVQSFTPFIMTGDGFIH